MVAVAARSYGAESGRRAVSVRGDIGEEPHCRAVVEQAVDELGRLDVLVNNAATQMSHERFLDIPPGEVERVFRTNVFGQFWLARAAIPHLEPGSAIVNTASIQAYDPSSELAHYAATKGAVATFTKALAKSSSSRASA
jgi:NAD(P)-dependent dehydrogenase (short-subunit alcohol dehydrogenase family)